MKIGAQGVGNLHPLHQKVSMFILWLRGLCSFKSKTVTVLVYADNKPYTATSWLLFNKSRCTVLCNYAWMDLAEKLRINAHLSTAEMDLTYKVFEEQMFDRDLFRFMNNWQDPSEQRTLLLNRTEFDRLYSTMTHVANGSKSKLNVLFL